MMTERDITDALIKAHREKFVCVPQCKTGATWMSHGMSIIDMWCMKKSWANPLVIAYEIKTHRSDFLNDNKWQGYLPYCNEFYFVVTGKKIAVPEEMADGIGLKYISNTGTRIYTKRKAVYRDVEIPQEIYQYILMSRAGISRNDIITDKKLFWKDWLKNKKLDHQLGHRVSKELREIINNELDNQKRENEKIVDENKELNEIKLYLKSIGIDYKKLSYWNTTREVVDRINEIESGLSKEFLESLQNCKNNIEKIQQTLARKDAK